MTTCNKNKEDRHWSHAGLLMQGRLKDRKEKRDNKDTLIKQITAITASDLYRLAFDRWLLQTYESETFNDSTPKFATVSAQVNGRLLIGLTRDNVLETSVTTQHAYGMPMLPGSAVKGAVRAYAEQLFCQKKGNKVVIEADENGIERTVIDRSWQPTLDILFGIDETVAQSSAGYLIWHDAWWIPDLASKKLLSNHKDQTNSSRPFVSDIVTVHHQQYYACADQMCEALEIEPPIPNKQLAVQGNFYFVIEGSQSSWVTFAKQLLEDTLQQFGLGAKGASGYGYFIKNEKLNQQLQQHYVVLRGYDKKINDVTDPDEVLRQRLSNLTEKELRESLSRNLTKFCQQFGLNKSNNDDCQKIATIVLEQHKSWVQGWQGKKNKTAVNAWKFIEKYKS